MKQLCRLCRTDKKCGFKGLDISNNCSEFKAESPVKGTGVISAPRCYVCEKHSIVHYEHPISYSVCSECKSVFVVGKDGTITCLDHTRAL
jgi:hypothetical protein